jgi:hypothetical protein
MGVTAPVTPHSMCRRLWGVHCSAAAKDAVQEQGCHTPAGPAHSCWDFTRAPCLCPPASKGILVSRSFGGHCRLCKNRLGVAGRTKLKHAGYKDKRVLTMQDLSSALKDVSAPCAAEQPAS